MDLPNIFDRPEVRESIALALKEDLGDVGVDVTSDSLVPPEALAEAHLIAREDCVLAGVACGPRGVFIRLILHWSLKSMWLMARRWRAEPMC